MNGRTATACNDIHRQTKPFFEDLLSEAEYRDFVAHLESCSECGKYVRSLGDLSNHLWKLGQIPAPSDFHESVLFKLRQPEPTSTAPVKKRVSRKWVIVTAVSVILLSLSSMAVNLKRTSHADKAEMPSPKTRIVESLPVETAVLFQKKDELNENAPVETPKPAISAPQTSVSSPAPEIAAREVKAASPKIHHWHVLYSKESHEALLRQQQEARRQRVSQQAEKLKDVKSQIARPEIDDATIKENVKDIQDEMNEIEKSETDFKRTFEDKKKKEISSRSRLADLIIDSGARMISQPSDLILFSVSGDTERRIVENILAAEQFNENFQDYTSGDAPAEEERTVAVYFDVKAESPLHWHVRPNGPKGKESALTIVREMGGSVSYDDNGLTVIMVPRTALEKLRLRFRAMKVSLSEFGGVGQASNVLSDAPVAISIVWM